MTNKNGKFEIRSTKLETILNDELMGIIEIHKGYVPGSVGRVVELHGRYYHTHWGFGAFFETKVAKDLAEFITRYDETRDGFWVGLGLEDVEGAIAIDGLKAGSEGVHLRWFIVSDALRGSGLGRKLIEAALRFCREKAHEKVYLWTFDGLHAARHLYEAMGFKLVEQHSGRQWGTEVTEQRFELKLG
jgi:GNAT superfamily N-acetyltransferase